MAVDDGEELHGLLMELVRVAGLLQPEFAGERVSMSQAFALHELDTDRPLSQRDLAERLGLEKSSVSRMVAEMERKGLLVRERDPGNRRFYRLAITEAGRAAHARIGSGMHDRYTGWMAAMTVRERTALATGLAALVRAMHGPKGET